MFLSQAEWEWLDPNQHDDKPVFLSLVRPKTDIQLLQNSQESFRLLSLKAASLVVQ